MSLSVESTERFLRSFAAIEHLCRPESTPANYRREIEQVSAEVIQAIQQAARNVIYLPNLAIPLPARKSLTAKKISIINLANERQVGVVRDLLGDQGKVFLRRLIAPIRRYLKLKKARGIEEEAEERMKMYQLVSVAYLNQMEEALEKARKLLPDHQLEVTEPTVIRRHAAQDQAPVIYDSVSDLMAAGPSTSKSGAPTDATAAPDKFDQVLQILPQNYRSKGREIVHFLRIAKAGLNDVNKLVYPKTGSIGSSLYGLLKFSILPERFKGKLQRPFDYTDFVELLKSVGAPGNLYDAASVGLTSIPQSSATSTRRRNLLPMLP